MWWENILQCAVPPKQEPLKSLLIYTIFHPIIQISQQKLIMTCSLGFRFLQYLTEMTSSVLLSASNLTYCVVRDVLFDASVLASGYLSYCCPSNLTMLL